MAEEEPRTPGREQGASRSGSGAGEDGDHWLDEWSIDQRLTLAAGLPLAILVIGAFFVAFQTDEVQRAHDRELAEERELAALVELEGAFSDVVEASQTYVVAADAQNRSHLDSRITTFEEGLSERQDPLEGPRRRADFAAFEDNATSYIEIARRAQGMIEDGDREGAQELLVSPRADRARTNAASSLEELQDAERRDVNRQRQAVDDARQALTRGLLLGTLGAILATGLVAYDLVSRTRSTLSRLSEGMREDLDRLASHREEEHGHLEEQAEAMTRAKASVNEVANASESVSERLDRSVHHVEAIQQAAKEGTKRLASLKAGLDETESELGTLTERILDVGEEIQQLGDTAGEMGELSEQVDMLALNASVEASRTGVETEGLNEVRELAERGQTRAQRLQEMATTAQTDTEAAAMALERSDKAVDQTRENTGQATGAFEQIEDFLEDGLAETRRMEELAEAQREALDDVATNLEQARGEAELAADSNEQVSQMVDELEDVARRLREVS